MHTSAAILLLAWTLGVSLWVDAACVKKTLTLTWERGAPNGQPRDMIFTNGQFPGPDLIFDEDDDAEVCNLSAFRIGSLTESRSRLSITCL